jgi:hypothetical protein
MQRRGFSDDWWSLSGPSRFLDKVAAKTNQPCGIVGLSFPAPPPLGWLEALTQRLDENAPVPPVLVDASAGLRRRSPVSVLAAAAGLELSGLRLIAEFVGERALADLNFLVHGLAPADWRQWSLFLRSFRSERQRIAGAGGPSIVLTIPRGIPPDDIRATLGTVPIRWLGAVSRLDTRVYVDMIGANRGDDLISRVALETTVEFGGWDRDLTRALASLTVEQQLDPSVHLRDYAAAVSAETPCWENALVDMWDGEPHVVTYALMAAGAEKVLKARLWSARVRAVFPFLNAIRVAFVEKYYGRLMAELPLTKIFNDRPKTYDAPEDLEFYDLMQILRPYLQQDENMLLNDCLGLRRAMAHVDPGDTWRIIRASNLWEKLSDDFPAASIGWDWPRCCKFARNTDPLRADFASKSGPLDCCVSILSCGPEWPGRVFGDGICGRDRRGSARVF